MGGDVLSENVIWAMVRETGDHGTATAMERSAHEEIPVNLSVRDRKSPI